MPEVVETQMGAALCLDGRLYLFSAMKPETKSRHGRRTVHKQMKKQDGLCELRFKADGVQQRPLGFHMPSNTFVILFWATERNNKFIPPGALQTAKARRLEVEMDGDRANALRLALE